MSAGFRNSGHEVVLAAENWDRARLVYDLNFDHAATKLDLSDIVVAANAVSRADPEMIIGGPPCQDFSVAGPRLEAHRADLTLAFAEIVRACRPIWFLMENVPAAAGSRAWRAARARLHSAGYGLTEVVLDASRRGVPQLRKRLFLVGRMNEQDNFLEDTLNETEAEHSLTVREYLGDELGIEFYYRHPRHWGRKAIFSINEPAATVRSTNRPIPPKYRSHPNDAAPIEGVKPLTSLQRARVQTFDAKHVFDQDLHTWEIDLMVANAVPVRLAENLGSAIGQYEELHEVSYTERDFRVWLQEQCRYSDRSAGNVLSRFKRARRLIGTKKDFADPRDEVHALQKSREYAALTSSVRSQLKKALLLHSEFTRRV